MLDIEVNMTYQRELNIALLNPCQGQHGRVV